MGFLRLNHPFCCEKCHFTFTAHHHYSWDNGKKNTPYVSPPVFFFVFFLVKMKTNNTRWAPTSYKWSYKPYKWPYKWVTGVITPFITSRGPTLQGVMFLFVKNWAISLRSSRPKRANSSGRSRPRTINPCRASGALLLRPSWMLRLVRPRTEMENIHPPKINMEPENGPLEKEIPIGNHHFQVPC